MKVKMLKDCIYAKEGHRIPIACGEYSDIPYAVAEAWIKKGICTDNTGSDKPEVKEVTEETDNTIKFEAAPKPSRRKNKKK